MLTNLTPSPFCGSIILYKKTQATDFFYIPTCNWNLRFLSIAVNVHIINKQCNQTVIIEHLKINCDQSQTAWNFSPDYKALGRKSLTPSDDGLQPAVTEIKLRGVNIGWTKYIWVAKTLIGSIFHALPKRGMFFDVTQFRWTISRMVKTIKELYIYVYIYIYGGDICRRIDARNVTKTTNVLFSMSTEYLAANSKVYEYHF